MKTVINTEKQIKTIGELKEYIKSLDNDTQINFYSQRCFSDCYVELNKWGGFDSDGFEDENEIYLIFKTKEK